MMSVTGAWETFVLENTEGTSLAGPRGPAFMAGAAGSALFRELDPYAMHLGGKIEREKKKRQKGKK